MHRNDTYGNIMRVLVFLSSSCLGPPHLRQTHLKVGCVRMEQLGMYNMVCVLLFEKEFVVIVGQCCR